jgi:hypothetical protein
MRPLTQPPGLLLPFPARASTVYRTSGTGAPGIVVEQWKSARGGKRERTRRSRYAKATFPKDRPQSRSIGWSGVQRSVRSSLPGAF